MQWSWTLRFGPYARATFATQPVLLVLPVLVGLVAGYLVHDDFGALGAATYGLFMAGVVVVLMLVLVAGGLRRVRRATRSTVQQYTITPDAVEIAVGQDRYSVPRSVLSLVRTGPDWVALRRRAMGTRRMILFFDDPLLKPHVLSILGRAAAPPAS
jgi:hypothetical protein